MPIPKGLSTASGDALSVSVARLLRLESLEHCDVLLPRRVLMLPEQLVEGSLQLTHHLIGAGANVSQSEIRVDFHSAALLVVLDDGQASAGPQGVLERREHPLRVIEVMVGVQDDHEVGSAVG